MHVRAADGGMDPEAEVQAARVAALGVVARNGLAVRSQAFLRAKDRAVCRPKAPP